MLSFFRSIRRSLINEGKTSRYVRYALGEVLLIMVGIILALQFQNWNEGRKLEQERRELIENLKADFKITLERLGGAIEQLDRTLEAGGAFFQAAGNETTNLTVEEIQEVAEDSLRGINYGPSLGSYFTAQAKGDLASIGDTTLLDLFADFDRQLSSWEQAEFFSREQHFLGARYDLRKILGSLRGTLTSGERLPAESGFQPPIFALDEEALHKVISQKEVYAAFENIHFIRNAQRNFLVGQKNLTEQILAALEEPH